MNNAKAIDAALKRWTDIHSAVLHFEDGTEVKRYPGGRWYVHRKLKDGPGNADTFIRLVEEKMATDDVPGADPKNGDTLRMGCWAEHADGSLIFVESTEGRRVIYYVFDVSKDPIVEYRDAMPQDTFEKQFKGWKWHDKTPMPWDRVIKAGAQEGRMSYASAKDQLSAAERVAERLHLRAQEVDVRRHRDYMPQRNHGGRRARLEDMIAGLKEQLDNLSDEDLDDNDFDK